jgi:hypothetical protein
MKAAESLYGSRLFNGVVGFVAATHVGSPAPAADFAPGRQAPKLGLFARIGEHLFRRQLRSVGAHVARADTVFESLDRWLWKQQMRETEAWLAKATDVCDLEARIRHLERGRQGSVL